MYNQKIKIALAQFDNITKNIDQTISKIEKIIKEASKRNIDIVVFPELFLTGYDLPWIMQKKNNCIFEVDNDYVRLLCKFAKKYIISYIIGLPIRINDEKYISALHINSMGEIETIISKNYLYGEEKDFFTPSNEPKIIDIKGFRIGIGICFDSAHMQHILSLKNKGMDMFIGSSLYGKGEGEREMIRNYSEISSNYNILSAVVNYANKTGEWLSCGNSSFYDCNGMIHKQLNRGEEMLLVSQIQRDGEMCKYI